MATNWSPGSAPTTDWDLNAGMDGGIEADNLSDFVERAETAADEAEASANSAAASAASAASVDAELQTYVNQAQTAATNAETAETNAEGHASDAETFANNASGSATEAAGFATQTASYVSSAQSSADASSASAIQSASSATDAQTAQTAAEAAQTAAESAQATAESIYDLFDDRYLGAKSSAPTVDNDGDALLTGAMYFNTTANQLYIWNGSAWDDAAINVSGAVTSFNGRSGAVTMTSSDVTTALGYNPQDEALALAIALG